MDKNKQFAINMIAQVVGFVVMMGISFLLTPFVVEHVGSEAYGFVGLANNFVGYAQVITVALNSMASRFITIKITENDVEGSNRYFTSVVIANIVTALVLSVPSAIIILNLNKIVNVSDAILIDVQWLWAFIFLNFLVSIISSTYSVATFVRNKLYLIFAAGHHLQHPAGSGADRSVQLFRSVSLVCRFGSICGLALRLSFGMSIIRAN